MVCKFPSPGSILLSRISLFGKIFEPFWKDKSLIHIPSESDKSLNFPNMKQAVLTLISDARTLLVFSRLKFWKTSNANLHFFQLVKLRQIVRQLVPIPPYAVIISSFAFMSCFFFFWFLLFFSPLTRWNKQKIVENAGSMTNKCYSNFAANCIRLCFCRFHIAVIIIIIIVIIVSFIMFLIN